MALRLNLDLHEAGLAVVLFLSGLSSAACGSGGSGNAATVMDAAIDVGQPIEAALVADSVAPPNDVATDAALPNESASAADSMTPASDAAGGTDDAASEASAGSCNPPNYNPAVSSFSPGNLTATIHDTADAPVANLLVQVTGLNLAFAGKTGVDGAVFVRVGFPEKNPAFRFGDGLTYGEFLVRLTAPGASLGTLHTVALPASGQAMAPGGSSTSGPLTLTIGAGATVSFDALTYDTPSKQTLRAAAIPASQAAVDSSVGLELVFGVAPLNTLFCPPAKARVPNSNGWAAGTAVDFYVLGFDVGQLYAPYGQWQKISTGQVTSDGSAIETADGAGLPILLTLGVRRR